MDIDAKAREDDQDRATKDASPDCTDETKIVLLFSTSLEKLREMLCDFKFSTEAVGLGIHRDKTKILSDQDKVKAEEITVNNIKIEVLKKETVLDILDKKSRSRSRKQKKSKTD